MTTARPQPSRNAGRGPATARAFTLLELLVALAVVAIVLGALFASLRIAFRAKSSTEEAVEPMQRAQIALSFLRRDLESALPPSGVLASLFQGSPADQDNSDLLFDAAVDAPPQATMQTDIRQIEYLVLTEGSDRLLVRRVTSNLLAPIVPDPDDEVVCRGVVNFSLQYYDGSNWNDTWDSTQQQNALPAAVQISLDLQPATQTAATLHVERLIILPCYVAPAGSTTGGAT